MALKQDDNLAFNTVYHCYSKSLYVYLLDKLTAYDIAGKNLALEVSFREAIFTAIHIVKHRRETVELQENPLTITKLSRDRD